jgi:hypothetical protein
MLKTITQDKFVTPSGATSSVGAPRFDQIPLDALVEVANRYDLGIPKHGEFNWAQGIGDEDFERDRYNHALLHLQKYWAKRKGFIRHGEDTPVQDLAAAAWGCLTLISCELRRERAPEKWQKKPRAA